MNTTLIKIAAADIDNNQKALEWIEEHGGALLDRDSCNFKISVTLYSASACTGATEATEMLSSYAMSLIKDILKATERGCANTIEIRRDQIKREIGK